MPSRAAIAHGACAVVAISLAGCGSSGGSSSQVTSTTHGPTTTMTTTSFTTSTTKANGGRNITLDELKKSCSYVGNGDCAKDRVCNLALNCMIEGHLSNCGQAGKCMTDAVTAAGATDPGIEELAGCVQQLCAGPTAAPTSAPTVAPTPAPPAALASVGVVSSREAISRFSAFLTVPAPAIEFADGQWMEWLLELRPSAEGFPRPWVSLVWKQLHGTMQLSALAAVMFDEKNFKFAPESSPGIGVNLSLVMEIENGHANLALSNPQGHKYSDLSVPVGNTTFNFAKLQQLRVWDSGVKTDVDKCNLYPQSQISFSDIDMDARAGKKVDPQWATDAMPQWDACSSLKLTNAYTADFSFQHHPSTSVDSIQV